MANYFSDEVKLHLTAAAGLGSPITLHVVIDGGDAGAAIDELMAHLKSAQPQHYRLVAVTVDPPEPAAIRDVEQNDRPEITKHIIEVHYKGVVKQFLFDGCSYMFQAYEEDFTGRKWETVSPTEGADKTALPVKIDFTRTGEVSAQGFPIYTVDGKPAPKREPLQG